MLLRGGAQCDLIGDERHSVVTRADSAHVLGSVCLQTKYHRDVMHLLRKPVQALMWLMMKGDNVQKASAARAVQFLTHDEDARHAFAHYKVPPPLAPHVFAPPRMPASKPRSDSRVLCEPCPPAAHSTSARPTTSTTSLSNTPLPASRRALARRSAPATRGRAVRGCGPDARARPSCAGCAVAVQPAEPAEPPHIRRRHPAEFDGAPPPPSLPRTKWTRRVPHPVLIGHAASLTPY